MDKKNMSIRAENFDQTFTDLGIYAMKRSNTMNFSQLENQRLFKEALKKKEKILGKKTCHFFHDIYYFSKENNNKIRNNQSKIKCLECDNDYVPELIIATIDPPEGLNIIGSPKLIEERICRPKENLKNEK